MHHDGGGPHITSVTGTTETMHRFIPPTTTTWSSAENREACTVTPDRLRVSCSLPTPEISPDSQKANGTAPVRARTPRGQIARPYTLPQDPEREGSEGPLSAVPQWGSPPGTRAKIGANRGTAWRTWKSQPAARLRSRRLYESH